MSVSKVYIIIVNFNGWKDTIECLESLTRLNYSGFQIIIIDNASADDSVDRLQAWARENNHLGICTINSNSFKDVQHIDNKLIMIQSPTNLGFAGGNNLGIKYALAGGDAEYVWLLNNDTIVEINSLKNLVDYAKISPRIGIIGSKIMEYYARTVIQAAGGGTFIKALGHSSLIGHGETDITQYNKSVDLKYVHGASMLVSIAFIKDVGLMSEDYFLYFEELDWSERGKQKGWRIGYCYKSVIYHKGGASTGKPGSYLKKSLASRFSDFYFQRAKILFIRKFYWYYTPILYLSFLFVIFNRLRRKQFDRIPLVLKILLNPKMDYPY